jgi:hypothetical protein
MNQQRAAGSGEQYGPNPPTRPTSISKRIKELKKGHTRLRPRTVLKLMEEEPMLENEPVKEVCIAIKSCAVNL